MNKKDGAGGARPPVEEMGSLNKAGTFRIERRLPGPVERVWKFITDANKRRLWFADGPMVLRASGDVSLRFKFSELTQEPTPAGYEDTCAIVGVITECRPPEKLSFTWGREPDASHVTFELSKAGSEVLLVITHVRIGDTDKRSGIASGWHAHLDLLREALGGAKALPFWKTKLSLRQSYGEPQ